MLQKRENKYTSHCIIPEKSAKFPKIIINKKLSYQIVPSYIKMGARQFRYLSRFLPLNHEIIKSTAKHRASQSNNRISPINCPVHTGLLYSGTNNMPAS